MLLFVLNLKMTLEAPGILTDNTKIQYLLTLLSGEAKNWKYGHHTFKPCHIGFRYVLIFCKLFA